MSQLKLFQSLFAEALAKTEVDKKLLSQLSIFIDTAKLDVAGQINIYHAAVHGSLGYALESIYPVCRKLVGDEFFHAMTQRFIQQTPSLSPDLNDYGKNLAGFIETVIPLDDIPYLPDIARLEWLWHQTFHAAASEAITAEELNLLLSSNPASLRLQPIEALHLFRSDYPVHRIWEMNQGDAETETIRLGAGPAYLVIWRDRREMRIDEVSLDVLNLLETLRAHQSAHEKFEAALATHESAKVLGYCLHRGWLRDVPTG